MNLRGTLPWSPGTGLPGFALHWGGAEMSILKSPSLFEGILGVRTRLGANSCR